MLRSGEDVELKALSGSKLAGGDTKVQQGALDMNLQHVHDLASSIRDWTVQRQRFETSTSGAEIVSMGGA